MANSDFLLQALEKMATEIQSCLIHVKPLRLEWGGNCVFLNTTSPKHNLVFSLQKNKVQSFQNLI